MTADQIMRAVHDAVRDDHPRGMIYAEGAADALLRAGLLPENEHRVWMLALKACPGHEDCRVWCSYCGNLATSQSSGSES